MAFPTVSDKGTTYNTGGTNTDPFVIDLPDNIASGDLLMAFLAADGNATFTWPSGASAWTRIVDVDTPSSAHGEVAYRIADATEGPTISVDPGATAEQGTCFTWRIAAAAWHGSTPPEATTATGTSASADPPALTPSWGSADTLWIAFIAENGGPLPVVTYPSGYVDNNEADESGGGGSAGGAIASKGATTNSDNPGTFDQFNAAWAAVTVAVRPAAAGPGGDTRIIGMEAMGIMR